MSVGYHRWKSSHTRDRTGDYGWDLNLFSKLTTRQAGNQIYHLSSQIQLLMLLIVTRAPLSHIDTEAVEIGINAMNNRPGRSSPMNMPMSSKGGVPVLIESGSYSEFPSKTLCAWEND